MPIHSGLSGRKSSSTRQAPKLPQIIQPMSPEEALPASIHAVSGLVHYIQQVLAGPMRGAGPFLRQYLINAQRSSNDLLKQLANKSDGTPDLPDSVVKAGVDLLALAADQDPELAAELATALDVHCSRTGHEQDAATAAVLAEATTLEVEATTADVQFSDGELWAKFKSSGYLRTEAGTVPVEIEGVMPVEHLNVSIGKAMP